MRSKELLLSAALLVGVCLVPAGDSRERDAAKQIFERSHASDISYTGEARV